MAFDATKLQTFISALAVDRGNLGLIVTGGEPKAMVPPSLSAGIASIDLDTQTDPYSIVSLLQDCAKRARWCRINLLDGSMPGRVYNQLRQLSTTGHLDVVQGAADGKEKNVKWPSGAKVVIVVNESVLKKIQEPTFLNLFGPVLR